MGSFTGMLLSYEIIRLTSNSKDETVLIEPFYNIMCECIHLLVYTAIESREIK
jgi:hypothetical protein